MDESKTKQSSLTPWPSPQDYNEAVQNPAQSFHDRELAASTAVTDAFGIPRPSTGMFASVYQMRSPDKSWALRCFLHFFPDQVERYAAIGAALREHKLDSTLDFELLEQGLLLHGKWYPILKMEWCDGDTLERWLAANLQNREALQKFQDEFREILKLFKQAGIAHGDLQHGNIMLSNEKIYLVDYDGMYVPALRGRGSHELGHRDYQHPKRSEELFSARLDNFSAWVIYLSIEILKHDPNLWTLLHGGEDCLLFRRADLERPRKSRIFYTLETHAVPEIQHAARMLRYIIGKDVDEIPFLDEPPVVAEDMLSPLLISAPWYKNEAGEMIQTYEEYEDDSEEYLRQQDQGPISRQGKRPRSKTKSGFKWTPGTVAKPEAKPEKPPVVLSPLAKLVRQVRSGTPPENNSPAFNQQGGAPPASTASNTNSSLSNSSQAGISPFLQFGLNLIETMGIAAFLFVAMFIFAFVVMTFLQFVVYK